MSALNRHRFLNVTLPVFGKTMAPLSLCRMSSYQSGQVANHAF
jgi:hypothetical protein